MYIALKKDEKCYSRIKKVLDKIQVRSKVRTITSEEIVSYCDILDKIYLRVCTKKALTGTKICVDINAQDFPSSYKYSAYSTQFTVWYKNNHWVLIDINRDYCKSSTNEIEAHLSDEAKESIIRYYEKGNR